MTRPLSCGWCHEENGEEIHPHPECQEPVILPPREDGKQISDFIHEGREE